MKIVKKNRFLLFLIFLLTGIASPLFTGDPAMQELLSVINYTLILATGLYAFSSYHGFLKITGLVFFLTIIVEWLQFIFQGPFLNSIQPLLTSVVLVLLLVMTLRSIRSAGEVDQDVIFGVIS